MALRPFTRVGAFGHQSKQQQNLLHYMAAIEKNREAAETQQEELREACEELELNLETLQQLQQSMMDYNYTDATVDLLVEEISKKDAVIDEFENEMMKKNERIAILENDNVYLNEIRQTQERIDQYETERRIKTQKIASLEDMNAHLKKMRREQGGHIEEMEKWYRNSNKLHEMDLRDAKALRNTIQESARAAERQLQEANCSIAQLKRENARLTDDNARLREALGAVSSITAAASSTNAAPASAAEECAVFAGSAGSGAKSASDPANSRNIFTRKRSRLFDEMKLEQVEAELAGPLAEDIERLANGDRDRTCKRPRRSKRLTR